jgi:hypothetical protein
MRGTQTKAWNARSFIREFSDSPGKQARIELFSRPFDVNSQSTSKFTEPLANFLVRA